MMISSQASVFSIVFAITEKRDIGLYEVPLYVFVEFWDRDYVSQFPCVRYHVFVKSSLSILVRNASPRGPMYLVPVI